MAGIARRSFDDPDDNVETPDGSRTDWIALRGDAWISRSTMQPGWNWTQFVGGGDEAATCPMPHRELVLAGRIRYRMEDGSEIIAKAGDYLEIQPGHLAWVDGDEPCVTIDW